MKTFTKECLQALKDRQLPRLKWHDVLVQEEGSEPPSQEQQRLMNDYFARFIPWQRNKDDKSVCVGCDRELLSGLQSFLIGVSENTTTLRYGLAHGEAFCAVCGYPARVNHYDIGGVVAKLVYGFQYHPEELTTRKEEVENNG